MQILDRVVGDLIVAALKKLPITRTSARDVELEVLEALWQKTPGVGLGVYLSSQLYFARTFCLLRTSHPAAENELIHDTSRVAGVKGASKQSNEKVLILFCCRSKPGCHL